MPRLQVSELHKQTPAEGGARVTQGGAELAVPPHLRTWLGPCGTVTLLLSEGCVLDPSVPAHRSHALRPPEAGLGRYRLSLLEEHRGCQELASWLRSACLVTDELS